MSSVTPMPELETVSREQLIREHERMLTALRNIGILANTTDWQNLLAIRKMVSQAIGKE